MIAVRMTVSGRVQGVFFRAKTKKMAESLGLKGQVKNLPDGTVEIIAQGSPENIQKLEEWAQTGPKFAKVDNLKKETIEIDKNYHEFIIEK